ncbi:helix-turn-helix transcriptional regulator [Austwickia chelonae]|uniref:helix-turn-helix transcriptional regulator n=1 Tax=Austwickia chelonae TaxID=100225 RepID=UPI001F076E7D|nr:helix-turn-helix domain-containing protein [Austwickia chelonae]
MFFAPLHGQDATRVRHQDARTREKVLRAVVEYGPVTAGTLAEELGLTPAGVRRHLDTLEDAGQIRLAPTPETRRGPGRPARTYVAGDVSQAGLTTEYDNVATQALRFLAEQAGPQAITLFARRRVANLEERYGPTVAAAGPDIARRTEALAAALSADGFAATARPIGHPTGNTCPATGALGLQLCQGHCPVQHVAAEFPQFCEAETEAFARLLGVHVQRLATLACGGHACTTYIPAGTPETTAAHQPRQSGDEETERSEG